MLENDGRITGSGVDIETGHPLHIMALENEAIEGLLAQLTPLLDEDELPEELVNILAGLLPIRTHYSKKSDLIFPLLKKYGHAEKVDDVWQVQDDVLIDLGRLVKEVNSENYPEEKATIASLLGRIEQTITQEREDIFPLSLELLSVDDWLGVYRDIPEMGVGFLEEIPVWEYAQSTALPESEHFGSTAIEDGAVKLPTGKLTLKQLEGIFNVIPAELTFADENEITRFVNEYEDRVFKRPLGAIGRNMFDCHPPRVREMVGQAIQMLKSGQRDSFKILRLIAGKQILVRYYPVHDEDGTYIGALEVVEDITSYIGGAI